MDAQFTLRDHDDFELSWILQYIYIHIHIYEQITGTTFTYIKMNACMFSAAKTKPSRNETLVVQYITYEYSVTAISPRRYQHRSLSAAY
jgi:hypothetical protein